MGLINIASNDSVWRGLDYYKQNKINNYKKISESEYIATVCGNNNQEYNVFMDISHPRKSKCDCPRAKDKRIICKHIIALYFTVFPKEVDIFLEEVEKAEKEYQNYEKELYKKVVRHIKSMSKNELQEALVEILNIAPEWVYERFIRDRVGF